jgi:hypothetical protein
MGDDQKLGQQWRTRAIGRLYVGPVQDRKNSILELTAREMEFKSSMESQKFMDSVGRKYAPKRVLTNARRLKHVSENDD